MFKIVQKVTEMAQRYVTGVVRDGDTVVDATLGNGWDTLFLSSLAPNGEVYAFEIQREAVESFKDKLIIEGINNVRIVNEGHETIDKHVKKRPRAVMFNLGYLPGGDEGITTVTSTTLLAIEKGLDLLLPGGIMTICVYIGHEEGEKEGMAVMDFIKALSSRKFSAMTLNYINKSSNPPFLIIIEKNDSLNGDTQSNLC